MGVGPVDWLNSYDAGSKVMPASLATGAPGPLPVAVTAGHPAVGVPVATFRQPRSGAEEVVILPDHQVGNPRQHRSGTLGADVRLFSVPGRHGADHPLAVGSAFPPGDACPRTFQVKLRDLAASLPSSRPARSGTGFSGHGTSGSVGTRHASILPQRRRRRFLPGPAATPPAGLARGGGRRHQTVVCTACDLS